MGSSPAGGTPFITEAPPIRARRSPHRAQAQSDFGCAANACVVHYQRRQICDMRRQPSYAALYAVIDTKHARALAANARRHERALRPLQTRPPLLRDTPRRSSACSQRARRPHPYPSAHRCGRSASRPNPNSAHRSMNGARCTPRHSKSSSLSLIGTSSRSVARYLYNAAASLC